MTSHQRATGVALVGALALTAASMQAAFADPATDQLRSEITGTGIFGRNTVAHLAGYGDVGFASVQDGTRSFSAANFNPIFHFQYKDFLFFETELGVRTEAEGGTMVELEYANLNYFVNDAIIVFGGKFIVPIGYFKQNLHPSWINKFASAPPGFGHDAVGAPTSDVGAGARGGFFMGSVKANYAFYLGNGPRLELNEAGDEIEMVEFEGATSNADDTLFFGGRFGLSPIANLQLGVSAGSSKVAVEAPGGLEPTRSYSVQGFDAAFQYRGIDVRGEYIQQKVGELASSVAPEAAKWTAQYAQAAYRFPGTGWEPVVRWGKVESPHPDQQVKQSAIGINYWFAANSVVKLDYERNNGEAGTPNDADQVLVQFAYGF